MFCLFWIVVVPTALLARDVVWTLRDVPKVAVTNFVRVTVLEMVATGAQQHVRSPYEHPGQQTGAIANLVLGASKGAASVPTAHKIQMLRMKKCKLIISVLVGRRGGRCEGTKGRNTRPSFLQAECFL